MFGITHDLPPPPYAPPVKGGVDDITIMGMPHSAPLPALAKLARQEFAERYEYMPKAIYEPAIVQGDCEAVRVLFEKPIDGDLAMEVFSDCADDIMHILRLSPDDIVICTSKTACFEQARRRMDQSRNPSQKPDGP